MLLWFAEQFKIITFYLLGGGWKFGGAPLKGGAKWGGNEGGNCCGGKPLGGGAKWGGVAAK